MILEGRENMDDFERKLRATMGDDAFVAAYRSAFGRLRDDRYGDCPLSCVWFKISKSL